MSGIEILGIAASVVSIADLGAKLSVKLFTFSRKVKHADKSIDSISKQIAFTGSVLQQLGSVLNEHDNARLCKPEYTASAKSLVEACEKIFSELNDAIDGGGKSGTASGSIVLGMRQRLKFPFLQPQIDLLQAKLESLQSSLQVMLQALVLAVSLKNHEAVPLLREQRATLETLVREQASMAKRLTQLTHQTAASQDAREGSPANLVTVMLAQADASPNVHKETRVSTNALKQLPMHLHRHAEEIFDHSRLLAVLMNEIDDARYRVDKQIRDASKDGLFIAHYDQWSSRLRGHVDAKEWSMIFADHPKLQGLWNLRNRADGALGKARLLWQRADTELKALHHQHHVLNQYRPRATRSTADSTPAPWHADRAVSPDSPSRTDYYDELAISPHTSTRASLGGDEEVFSDFTSRSGQQLAADGPDHAPVNPSTSSQLVPNDGRKTEFPPASQDVPIRGSISQWEQYKREDRRLKKRKGVEELRTGQMPEAGEGAVRAQEAEIDAETEWLRSNYGDGKRFQNRPLRRYSPDPRPTIPIQGIDMHHKVSGTGNDVDKDEGYERAANPPSPAMMLGPQAVVLRDVPFSQELAYEDDLDDDPFTTGKRVRYLSGLSYDLRQRANEAQASSEIYNSADSSGFSTPIYGMSYEEKVDDNSLPLSSTTVERRGEQEASSSLRSAKPTWNSRRSERPASSTLSYLPSGDSLNQTSPSGYQGAAPTTAGLTWSNTLSARLAPLRKTLTSVSESDDPYYEDASHVSNALRAYYTEKGRIFPAWLPPDPRVTAAVDRMKKQRSTFETMPPMPGLGTGGDHIGAASARERLRARLQGTVVERSSKDTSPPESVLQPEWPSEQDAVDSVANLMGTWTALDAKELHFLSEIEDASNGSAERF